MANKLSNALDNVVAALEDLKQAGYLKAVKRAVINPFGQMELPVLGVKMVRYRREGSTWIGEVLLMLVTGPGAASDAESNVDLAARVTDALDTLQASGDAGCLMDAPTWDPWDGKQNESAPLLPIGSLGGLSIRVEDPILIPPEEP